MVAEPICSEAFLLTTRSPLCHFAGCHFGFVTAPVLQVDEVRHHLPGRPSVGDDRKIPQGPGSNPARNAYFCFHASFPYKICFDWCLSIFLLHFPTTCYRLPDLSCLSFLLRLGFTTEAGNQVGLTTDHL